MPLLQNLKVAGDFSETGPSISCPASAGIVPTKTTLVSRTIPSGAIAFLKTWSAVVDDIGDANQIFFMLLRNGIPIQPGLSRVPGTQFAFNPQLELGIYLNPGLIEIVALNISGANIAIEPLAVAGVAIKCSAWWQGVILSEKGGVS